MWTLILFHPMIRVRKGATIALFQDLKDFHKDDSKEENPITEEKKKISFFKSLKYHRLDSSQPKIKRNFLPPFHSEVPRIPYI